VPHHSYVILEEQQGDGARDSDSDLQEERQTVVRRLLDAYFGRSPRSEEAKEDIHRIGTITRLLKGNDESPSQAP
jgi:hypothetical protein